MKLAFLLLSVLWKTSTDEIAQPKVLAIPASLHHGIPGVKVIKTNTEPLGNMIAVIAWLNKVIYCTSPNRRRHDLDYFSIWI